MGNINKIQGLKEQLLNSGITSEIASNPRIENFLQEVSKNPEFAGVFMEFYNEYIKFHKEKLIASADGEIDQVINGHLNALKQVQSPLDFSQTYIEYQEAEQEHAVDALEYNKPHFQELIDKEKDAISEIVNKNPEYAKTPKFIDLIENEIEAIDYINSNNIYFEAAEKPKSGKRKFRFNWSLNKKKKDLILIIALLTEELDAEQLEAMQEQIALQKSFDLEVGGVVKAVLENFKELQQTGKISKTYAGIAKEWGGFKTQNTNKTTPPVEITYEEILIANIVTGMGVNK